MKRQAFYLPNLNTLLSQNRHLARHQQRLKQASSQYHQASNSSFEPVESKREPSPFQRRQRREQLRENARMSKAMDVCPSTVTPLPKKKQEAYSSLKQRIRKFTTEGNAVTYKYEKSLLQFEKQRQFQDHFWSQRAKELQGKEVMDAGLLKQPKSNQKVKTSISEHNDIFYKDGDSLCLYQTAPRKLTLNYPRSLTPQSFITHVEDERGRTQKIQIKSRDRLEDGERKMEKLKIKSSTGQSQQQIESRGRYRSEVYSQISKSIKDIIMGKISRTMNPEIHFKKKQKTPIDMQIIQIAPVN